MRKLLLTTTALVAISGGAAFAADLPSKAVAPMVPAIPYTSWTGPYIAGIVGVGRLNAPPPTRALLILVIRAAITTPLALPVRRARWLASKSAMIGKIAPSFTASQRIGPGPV